jgi:branched-chain amino acid transport system substrate-binding protein
VGFAHSQCCGTCGRGCDRLDLKATDYLAALTKVKQLNPDARQAYEMIPNIIKTRGDGVLGPEMLTAVGFLAAEGGMRPTPRRI